MPPHSAPFSALRRSMFVFAAAAVLSTTTTAFVVPSSFTSTTSSSSSSSTALFISSWGAKGPPAFRQASARDPEKRIQDYLPEPGAVEARSNIDGTILVSSSSSSSDSISSNDAQPPQQQRTDQFLFDLLNHQDSAFEFKTITAFVQDAAVAKKKLLSRSARYTGLLDKLQFVQALDGDQPYSLPTVEQLQGVKTWLAVLEHHHSSPPLDTATATANENNNNGILLERCHAIAKLVASVDSIENIAILLLGANELDAVACQSVVDALAATGNQYTIVGVGHVEDDRPEGSTAYHYGTFGTPTATTTTTSGDTTTAAFLPNKAVFAREEAYRLVTELLQLECGVNQTLLFAEVYNPNVTEAKLIKGLREAGYARPQEIDHMIRLGPKAYTEAIEKFRTEFPDSALGYTTNAWWEADEFKLSRQRSDDRMAATAQAVKDARTIEIEGVAKEWAKREYFRASMAGTVENNTTEEEFIQSVWERAMFEGDLKFRISKGETVDESTELANFQSQQERKQQVMLQRAKAELSEILQEDFNDKDDLVPAGGKKSKKDGDDDK